MFNYSKVSLGAPPHAHGHVVIHNRDAYASEQLKLVSRIVSDGEPDLSRSHRLFM